MRAGEYACAIFRRDGLILLGRREAGETLEETLAREMREEVGVTPRALAKLDVLLDPFQAGDKPTLYHIYVVDAWDGGEPSLINHEHTELQWFGIADACAQPDLALPSYREIFQKLTAPRCVPER
jgi:8-oxo-dGTP pyrophosphatase MutT (NUDIX family)